MINSNERIDRKILFFSYIKVSHTLKNLIKLSKINNGSELHARQGMNKMDDKYEKYTMSKITSMIYITNVLQQ